MLGLTKTKTRDNSVGITSIDTAIDTPPPSKTSNSSTVMAIEAFSQLAPSLDDNVQSTSAKELQQEPVTQTLAEDLPNEDTNDRDRRLVELEVTIDKVRQMHLLSFVNLKSNYFWISFLPSIILTLAAGILSAIENKKLGDNGEEAITIIALVAAFWQSIGNQLNYGSRADLHHTTATALTKLKTQIDVQKNFAVDDTFLLKSVELYNQAVQGCTSTVPAEIQSAFELVKESVALKIQPPLINDFDTSSSLDTLVIYQMAFGQLFDVIRSYVYFPLSLPTSKIAVEKALHNFEKKLIEENSLISSQSKDSLFKLLLDRAIDNENIESRKLRPPSFQEKTD